MNNDDRNDAFVEAVGGFCRQHALLPQDCRAMVALSGGADSVCLLRVLLRMGVPVVAAHCNFHLRGNESMRDERFVRSLCATLGVRLASVDFDVPARVSATGESVEMACRSLRYEWFERQRVALGCDVIAVAHHADDNVETFWLNAVRGTGIAGLTGIHPVNRRIVRPLLGVHRADIVRWLDGIGQDYVTDSTNLENDVKRNRLRNVVLPALYGQLPEARRTLPATIDRVSDCYGLYCEAVALMRGMVAPGYSEAEGFGIDAVRLMGFANAEMLLFEMLRPMGFNRSQCADAIEAMRHGSGEQRSFNAPQRTLVVKGGAVRVEMCTPTCEPQSFPVALAHGLRLDEPVKLSVEVVGDKPFTPAMCNGSTVIALDAAVLRCRQVTLRHWRRADRFRPFGMRGTKLLSDLFSDLHLDAEAKRRVWILEADGQILWVVGLRASAHFPVDRREGGPFVLLSVAE